MPFVAEEPRGENYDRLKRRQIVVWSFLVFLLVGSLIFLLYIAYQVMKGNSQGGTSSSADVSVMTPVSKIITASKPAEDNNYFLYGQFSQEDSKYRLYKIHYRTFAKEEFFSFLWRDASSRPSFAFLGDNVGVFPDVDKGFLISPEGKMIIAPPEFIPPDAHFSVSPDKKRMFYFTYLSSVGTTSLTLRDMENGKDIFKWPVSSSASQLCDFATWSDDGTQTYCLAQNGTSATLKIFDSVSYAVNTVATKSNVLGAAYYPQAHLLLAASRDAISVFSTASSVWRDLLHPSSGVSFENALLIPDGSGVLYTARTQTKSTVTETVHFISLDGSRDTQISATDPRVRLVSITPDAQSALLAVLDATGKILVRYSLVRLDGTAQADYAVGAPFSATQFVSWAR